MLKIGKCPHRWFIDAVGLLCHAVSRDFIGTGPATSTNLSKFTGTTFATITVEISKVMEYGGLLPNFRE